MKLRKRQQHLDATRRRYKARVIVQPSATCALSNLRLWQYSGSMQAVLKCRILTCVSSNAQTMTKATLKRWTVALHKAPWLQNASLTTRTNSAGRNGNAEFHLQRSANISRQKILAVSLMYNVRWCQVGHFGMEAPNEGRHNPPESNSQAQGHQASHEKLHKRYLVPCNEKQVSLHSFNKTQS